MQPERFRCQWGTNGSGDGQFYYPRGIAVDSTDKVYVADSDNHRIQKFNAAGTFRYQMGRSGLRGRPVFLSQRHCRGFADKVYVADSNSRIQKFDASGTFIEKWGSYGSHDGEFN